MYFSVVVSFFSRPSFCVYSLLILHLSHSLSLFSFTRVVCMCMLLRTYGVSRDPLLLLRPISPSLCCCVLDGCLFVFFTVAGVQFLDVVLWYVIVCV